METLKEIILITVFVVILVAAIFFGSRYLLDTNITQTGENTLESINNGETIVTELDNKNNKNLNKYIEKYDDKTKGYVAYILSRIQIYSIPICTLLFVLGAFLYYVISIKKFTEGERGYGMIVSSIIFLAIAQIAPLIFALVVTVGRS